MRNLAKLFLLSVLTAALLINYASTADSAPIQSLALLQPLAQQVNCPNAPATHLAVGMTAQVTPPRSGQSGSSSVRVRAQPGTAGSVTTTLQSGVTFTIVAGPQCVNNYLWWQIDVPGALSGWVAEGDASGYFIQPVTTTPTTAPLPTSTPAVQATAAIANTIVSTTNAVNTPNSPAVPVVVPVNCPNAPSTNFAVGLQGEVRKAQAGTPNSVRVRDSASTSGKVLTNLPESTPFTVIGGPQCVSGFVWWQIKTNAGDISGWVAEGDSNSYFILPLGYGITPSPSPSPLPPTIDPKLPTATATIRVGVTINCPAAMPSRLVIGLHGMVPGDGATVRVHVAPGTATDQLTQRRNGSAFEGQLKPGQQFTIIGGPSCVNGTAWWKIQDVPDTAGYEGWVAESQAGNYLLAPVEVVLLYTATASSTPTSTFTPSLTHTPTPTYTPTLTYTPSRTRTPTNTYTPSKTFTPSFTPTLTPSVTPSVVLTPTPFTDKISAPRSMALDAGGQRVLVGYEDGTARLWDVATGTQLRVFNNGAAKVLSVAISPDGKQIAIANRDGIGQLWDIVNGKVIQKFDNHADSFMNAITFSPDGKYILTGSDDGIVHLWLIGSAEKPLELKVLQGEVLSAAFTSDSAGFLIGNSSGKGIFFYESTPGDPRAWTRDDRPDSIFYGTPNVAISGVGYGTLTTSAGSKGSALMASDTLRFYNGPFPTTQFVNTSGNISSLAVSMDGTNYVTGHTQGAVILWDARGNVVATFKGHTDVVTGVAITPDGKYILSCAGGTDKTVRLWDVLSGQEVRRFPPAP